MHKTSVYLIVIEWRAKLKKLPDLHKLITILTRSFCKTKSKRVQVPPASAIYIILLEYDPKIYSRFSFQWPQLRVDYCLYVHVEQTFIHIVYCCITIMCEQFYGMVIFIDVKMLIMLASFFVLANPVVQVLEALASSAIMLFSMI